MTVSAETSSTYQRISAEDALFLDRIRGLSILRVVLVHLGLSWFLPPYSQFVHMFLPLLFFVSGAVSFYSFKRAPSLFNYSIRRLLSILMPYYLIVVAAFIYIWLSDFRRPLFDMVEILDWLFVAPDHADMPFPMGQIWFIHAIAIMVIISLPIFVSSRLSPWPLLVGTVLSVLLTLVHQIYEISRVFNVFGHNFYQAFSNVGYFMFGAFFYNMKGFFTGRRILGLSLLCFMSLIVNVVVFDVEMNMAHHTYAPDFYYISAGFLAIFLVLLLKPLIDKILGGVSVLDWFFLYLSRHAYSVFMLHSLVLFLVETQLGLVDVAENPLSALLKIVLVVSLSCLFAVPVTKASRYVTKLIQNNVIKTLPAHEIRRRNNKSGIRD